jgi:hypothetical protein
MFRNFPTKSLETLKELLASNPDNILVKIENELSERKANGVKYLIESVIGMHYTDTFYSFRFNSYLDAVLQTLPKEFEGTVKVICLETEIVQYVKVEGKTLTYVDDFELKYF